MCFFIEFLQNPYKIGLHVPMSMSQGTKSKPGLSHLQSESGQGMEHRPDCRGYVLSHYPNLEYSAAILQSWLCQGWCMIFLGLL